MKGLLSVALAAICLAALCSPARPCSTFQLTGPGLVLFGRNYDWQFSDALILVNKRAMGKTSYPRRGDPGRPAQWVSKYGSLTFNVYGREFPTGGMNSAGLVVECMALYETAYPPPDERAYVASDSIWRQYILDNCATVEEALATLEQVRLAPLRGVLGTHMLVSDARGDCAVLEFLDQRAVIHQGPALPVHVLTNSPYEQSLHHLQQGTDAVWDPGDSTIRFKRVARMIRDYRPASLEAGVGFAFKVLEAVAADRTQWRIVYDQVGRRVYFLTKRNPAPRCIDLARLDFSCRSPVMMLDVDAPGRGEMSGAMAVYTPQANRELIGRSFGLTSYTKNIPAAALDFVAQYGDKGRCVGR